MKYSTELIIIPGGFYLYKVMYGNKVEYSHSKSSALNEMKKRLKLCNIAL